MLLQPLARRTHRVLQPRLILPGINRSYATNLREVLGPRRALVYKNTGDPSQVLYATTNTEPVHLKPGEVAIRFLLSPINPANVRLSPFDIRHLTEPLTAQHNRRDLPF